MGDTIKYKGHEILKKQYTPFLDPYKKLDSNYFEMSEEDLEKMLEDLRNKKLELENRIADYKNLRYQFDVNEDHSDDDYWPYDASCEISFLYDVLESDEESKERIDSEKESIDQMVEEEKRRELEYEDECDCEVRKAISFLESQGYSVNRK